MLHFTIVVRVFDAITFDRFRPLFGQSTIAFVVKVARVRLGQHEQNERDDAHSKVKPIRGLLLIFTVLIGAGGIVCAVLVIGTRSLSVLIGNGRFFRRSKFGRERRRRRRRSGVVLVVIVV